MCGKECEFTQGGLLSDLYLFYIMCIAMAAKKNLVFVYK